MVIIVTVLQVAFVCARLACQLLTHQLLGIVLIHRVGLVCLSRHFTPRVTFLRCLTHDIRGTFGRIARTLVRCGFFFRWGISAFLG